MFSRKSALPAEHGPASDVLTVLSFDSATVLGTIVLIDSEGTQERMKNRKSEESHQLPPSHCRSCRL